MIDGAHRFIERKIQMSLDQRDSHWSRKADSKIVYEQSVEPNLARFRKAIGLEDSTNRYPNFNVGLPDVTPQVHMQHYSENGDVSFVSETDLFKVYQVRWPVLEGVWGEGLLLQPKQQTVANVVALPDADQTPEQLIGLSPGIGSESQFARRLAESGIQVLVPVLISRDELEFSNNKQTYREWIYRQAFHMGRHIIGYEVEKVSAAVDWFKEENPDLPVGVAGYCEGGLIALYAGAVNKQIDVVLTSGYFKNRDKVWDEPIYRNIYGLLSEFGDAEIASMVAPRSLIVEHSVLDRELIRKTKKPVDLPESGSGYKGQIVAPEFEDVKSEFERIAKFVSKGLQVRELIAGAGGSAVEFGSDRALRSFAKELGIDRLADLSSEAPMEKRQNFDAGKRQIRQVKQLEGHVQNMLHLSDQQRNRFFLHNVMPEFGSRDWSTAAYHRYFPKEKFIEECKDYRKYYWEEILGKFEEEYLPPNAQTKKIYDRELWTGYEVELDVYEDLIAPGVLLIPKDILPGEKRPVVVVQHGRGGVPGIVIEGNTSYYNIGEKLADQGFIVYATYGLFRGEDRYRWLDRKANTIGKTLFSLIIAQHDQHLNWLGSLPFVDSERIAFYGKSYGGETAMRVPSVLEGYCLSICSADFGDWTRKVVDTRSTRSFMSSVEWEMPYFNMGSTFSYAEMAYLIFPRPFMVERGRHDRVQPDDWVGYEYAKVEHLYDQFNLVDHTEIEFFNGGHASRNQGTFDFLHKFLNWP